MTRPSHGRPAHHARSSVRRPTGHRPHRRRVARALNEARALAREPRVLLRTTRRVGRRLVAGAVRGTIAGSAAAVALVVLALLGVIPVRTYIDQKRQLQMTEQHVALLDGQNRELAQQVSLLRTRAEIERLARRQFGMVRPGERALAIPGLRASPDGIVGDESLPPVIGAAPPAQDPPKISLMKELMQLAQFWR